MDLIAQFIDQYAREIDYYSQAGRFVADRLEEDLRDAGVRCIVTHRAKSIARLEDKCRQREGTKKYSTISDIVADIVDLAGVRVALYFPAEREQVDGAVRRLFTVLQRKEFPETSKSRPGGPRFGGYAAVHYHVNLREHGLAQADKRYVNARVEIQVASVLMHAWSEVEHDLVYKPTGDELSGEEYALLDQLNGLVMAGEIALENLQKASIRRVADQQRTIRDHYELATHLLGQPAVTGVAPVSEEGLGRIDLLFVLLNELGLDTPEKIDRYLDGLHDNLEQRPLSEQVIDAVLAEDPKNRYNLYASIRHHKEASVRSTAASDDLDATVGAFLRNWLTLENTLRDVAEASAESSFGPRPSVQRWFRYIVDNKLLDDNLIRAVNYYRRLRNRLVHGVDMPSIEVLREATLGLDGVINEIERRDL